MTRHLPRPSLFAGAFAALTALLTAITAPNLPGGTNGAPTRKSSRSGSRFTRPGEPGPQRNLYRMPAGLFREGPEIRLRAEGRLDLLASSDGSQAVMQARRIRTADGWRAKAVADPEQLRIARNQRRKARRRFAA